MEAQLSLRKCLPTVQTSAQLGRTTERTLKSIALTTNPILQSDYVLLRVI
jgi:hypothetical protein